MLTPCPFFCLFFFTAARQKKGRNFQFSDVFSIYNVQKSRNVAKIMPIKYGGMFSTRSDQYDLSGRGVPLKSNRDMKSFSVACVADQIVHTGKMITKRIAVSLCQKQ